MTTILTDSMAREHAESLQAAARASRRARAARTVRRDVRRAERAARRTERAGQIAHPRAAAVGHAAARPFSAARNWLVTGQL